MTKKKDINDYLRILFWIVVFLLVIIFFESLIYNMFTPQTPDVYKFEVTGVISEANATTAASLHLECIKYCVSHTSNYKSLCYEACKSIGQEGCVK